MVNPKPDAMPLGAYLGELSGTTRRSGIDVIGDVTWGTHFCLFYQTKQDLLDILVPYFKAGLEQNEFCMWVTSEPLTSPAAKKALAAVVDGLDGYVDNGQMEILDYSDWYTRSGRFEADDVLQGWVSKESVALRQGFDGLRLTGNTLWLEKRDWAGFSEYEKRVNEIIGEHKMIAICTYSLERCGAPEIMDVLSTHQFALVEREGKWEVIESAERERVDEALRRRDRELTIKNKIDHIFSTVLGDEMYEEVLEIVLHVTHSESGFFGYIDQDGALVLPSLTRDVWERCRVPGKDIVFPREQWGGIWGRALTERRALLSNEPGRVPEGHIPVLRAAVAPIVADSNAIGVIGIANRPINYDGEDIRLLERVASHLAPALRARLQRDREESHRKLAEEKLREYGERLERLVEERTDELQSVNALLERIFSTTHILIAYMDTEFNFIRVNRAYAEADGHKPEFYIGKNHFELFPHAENESIFRQVVDTGESHTARAKPFEYAEHPERGVTHWDWTLQPVIDTSGTVEGVVLVLVDVTELIRAQETMLESEENFRALAENAGDGIIIITRAATLAYANKRAGEISGYSVAELLDMTLGELMHVDELHKVMDRLEKRISGEPVPPHYETVIAKKDGGTLPVEIAGARTVWHGEPADLVIVRDISARKASEAALIQSEKLALTGRLAASLAHEINNPLQTVIGCLGLAAESLPEGADVHRHLQIGREELKRAAGIVAQLRDLQRPSEAEERELTDLHELLRRVLTVTEKQCTEQQVEVSFDSAADLPAVKVVPHRIQQVFLNLMLNAVEAMPGGGTLRIATIRSPNGEAVKVIFADSGTGINPDDLLHIFDPFYSGKPEGLGLGLFISRNIVADHGGHIEVETSLGEGTTFTVWLPMKARP
jgi:PAS domain S-box-containing protein